MTEIAADVAVVGAGASGIAAALAAARHGARVVLIERYGFLGGMGTSAAIGSFCGMYSAGERARPIATAVGWSVVRALLERRGSYRFAFGRTRLVHYDTEILKRVYDDLIAAAGVRVLGHAVIGEPTVRARRIECVIAMTQRGPIAVHAPAWIDASGDAVLADRAGAATELGAADVLQPATLVFRMANVDLALAESTPRAQLNARMADDAASGDFALPRTSGGFYRTTHPGEVVINMTRVAVDGIDAEDMTRAEAAARRQVGEYARWLIACIPGFALAYVSAIGTQIGIRETRRLIGRARVTADDLRAGRRLNGDVGEGAWPIEIHDPRGSKTTLEWLPDDTVYGVPFDATVACELDNLWVIGRCMSATRDAHASTRVMGTCFSVGEAVGAIAAIRGAAGSEQPAQPAELDRIWAWRREVAAPPDGAWPEDRR